MNTKGLETNTQKMNRLEAEVALLRGDLLKWSAACDESRIGLVLPMPPLVEALHAELEKAKAENARLAAALEHYATCSDGCTCGDGWSHDLARVN